MKRTEVTEGRETGGCGWTAVRRRVRTVALSRRSRVRRTRGRCRVTQRRDPTSHPRDRLTETLLLPVCLPSHRAQISRALCAFNERARSTGRRWRGGGVQSKIWWDPGQQSRVTGSNLFKSSEHDICGCSFGSQSLQLCV